MTRPMFVAAVVDRGGAVIEYLPDRGVLRTTAVNDRGYTRRLMSGG
jgi:hypothetical protein